MSRAQRYVWMLDKDDRKDLSRCGKLIMEASGTAWLDTQYLYRAKPSTNERSINTNDPESTETIYNSHGERFSLSAAQIPQLLSYPRILVFLGFCADIVQHKIMPLRDLAWTQHQKKIAPFQLAKQYLTDQDIEAETKFDDWISCMDELGLAPEFKAAILDLGGLMYTKKLTVWMLETMRIRYNALRSILHFSKRRGEMIRLQRSGGSSTLPYASVKCYVKPLQEVSGLVYYKIIDAASIIRLWQHRGDRCWDLQPLFVNPPHDFHGMITACYFTDYSGASFYARRFAPLFRCGVYVLQLTIPPELLQSIRVVDLMRDEDRFTELIHSAHNGREPPVGTKLGVDCDAIIGQAFLAGRKPLTKVARWQDIEPGDVQMYTVPKTIPDGLKNGAYLTQVALSAEICNELRKYQTCLQVCNWTGTVDAEFEIPFPTAQQAPAA